MPASQRRFLFLKKGLLLFSEPCCPTLHPHKSSLPRAIYVIVAVVVSVFPKHALKQVTHFYDDGLFQNLSQSLVWSCGTTCRAVTIKGQMIVSDNMYQLELTVVNCSWQFLHLRSVSELNPVNCSNDSNVVCLTFVPPSLLTYDGAINSKKIFYVIRWSVLQIAIQYQPIIFFCLSVLYLRRVVRFSSLKLS